MHIIGIITALAVMVYWISRASGGFGNILGFGRQVANAPRQHKFRKAYHKKGYDLVETPLEAATVLMISLARLGEYRTLSRSERVAIETELQTRMEQRPDDADGLVRQMDSLTHDVTLPESALFPMVEILRGSLSREHAEGLAQSLKMVARSDGTSTAQQTDFIRRYQEYMNLDDA